MAWRQPGDKPLSVPMMVYLTDAYMSLGLSELTKYLNSKSNEIAVIVPFYAIYICVFKNKWVY